MNPLDEILTTAHIHLETATLRVHVVDSNVFPFDIMNEDEEKPDFVNWVYKSNDPEQNKNSILVQIVQDFNLQELSQWISKYDKYSTL